LIEHAKQGGPATPKEERALKRRERLEQERQQALEERRNISFKQFFEEVYLPDATTRLKPDTCRKHVEHVRNWIHPVTGNNPLRELGLADVQRIRGNMARKGRSARTQQYCLMTFQLVWNAALESGVVDRPSPTKLKSAKPPKVDNERLRFLSDKEATHLIECVQKHGPQAANMVLVGLDAGLRFSEIAGLTWGCVDFECGGLHVLDTKGKRDRTVPMTSRLRDLFTGMERSGQGELVFPAPRTGQIQRQVPSSFWYGLRDSKLNEGVTNPKMRVNFHTTRHTYGSRLAQQGVDLLHIQRLMGHSTPALSARYSKLRDEDLAAAVARMESREKMKGQAGKLLKLREATGGD
jgi:Site-specific recombinase XerD